MTKQLQDDFDAPSPPPEVPPSLRYAGITSPEERQEIDRKMKAKAPPPPVHSTVAEQRATAANPSATAEQRKLALAILRDYAEAYAAAGEIYGADCDAWWRHFEGSMRVLREHNVSLGDQQ